MDIQISEKFIDEQLARSNGEFLKVYLYILRYANARPDDEQIADALNMTEKDVQRAIAYWKKEGVLDSDTARREVDIEKLSGDDEFRALLHALQNYMERRFTAGDVEILGYMYDQLGFPSELIEYLFELCKQKGKTSLRYIEKVAQGWHEKGIRTVDDAKKDSSIFSAEISEIRRHMGISSRELAKSEMDYINRWLRIWRLPADVVCEACSRTVLSTGKTSFLYADSILKSWYEAGVHTLSQLKEYDKAYAESLRSGNEGVTSAGVSSAGAKPNAFHNFDERQSDKNKDKKSGKNSGKKSDKDSGKNSGKNTGLDADVMDKFNDLFK